MKHSGFPALVTALVLVGCPLAAAAQTSAIVYPQGLDSSGLRAIVQDAMRELLTSEPELIANALQAAQAKQAKQAEVAQAAAMQAAVRAKNDPMVPSIGPLNGKMVVEFLDYNCGHCKNFATQTFVGVQAVRKDVRWSFVFAPILGEGSQRLAEFAAAAQLQGKFEPVHHYLLAQKEALSTAKAADDIRAQLIQIAGLDQSRFDAALKSGEAMAIVAHHRAIFEQARLRGTPMIVTETTVIPGFVPAEVLLQHIR